MLDVVSFNVEEVFTTRLLGSSPADPEVYTNFIASKRAELEERRKKFAERHGTPPPAPLPGTVEEELETLPDEESKMTVFHNDLGKTTEEGTPGKGVFLYDYQVQGFYKEAAEVLVSLHGILQPRSKLDNFLMVTPRRVYITDDQGVVLTRPDGTLERPLKAMTMQGPRVSLACSTLINPGRRIKYTCEFLPFIKSGRGKEGKEVNLEEFVSLLLSYGPRKGRGQWRNGGNGRFRATFSLVKK